MRESGILLHISSLPGGHGIGGMGKSAYNFVDFLSRAGQKYWQILPIGPTSVGNSPYQSFSAYAGNPYFIDLETLHIDGLLPEKYLIAETNREVVDFDELYSARFEALNAAYESTKTSGFEYIRKFREDNSAWLEDYALFMALKQEFGETCWLDWEKGAKNRNVKTINLYKEKLAEKVNFWVFLQYHFFKQWRALKRYANERGIKIIGDVPIYVATDSADVWSRGELFQLDRYKRPRAVAGCPPDYFSETGQIWDNPLYDWNAHQKQGFKWWIERMKFSLSIFDVVRIDHFRGFESYYSIPYGAKTAEIGQWRKGPGMKLFDALKTRLGKMSVIAEDLGIIGDRVRRLLKNTGFPGMKILQFAFDSSERSSYLPHNIDSNCVVYTGTHDNNTIAGWFGSADRHDVDFAVQYLGLNDKEGYNWGFIRGAYQSAADLAIIQMQDFLNLPAECRMNTPSTVGNNWRWRVRADDLTDALADKIARLVFIYGR